MRLAYILRMLFIPHVPITSSPRRRIDRSGGGFTGAFTGGFTLVELLVVIGIIALLISLLLPALSVARQASLRVACSAKLKTVLLAAQIHTIDHHGFYPLAGVLPGWAPTDFDDPYSRKYDYATYAQELSMQEFPVCLNPITISLSAEMTYHKLDGETNDQIGKSETDGGGFVKNFLCPAQASSISDLTQLPELYVSNILVYTQAESYIFNEAIVGWGQTDSYNRLKGRASRVRQPTATMFVADGLMGSVYKLRMFWPPNTALMTVYNISLNPPITLADALMDDGKAGDPENFDLHRHRGKINIGFCDGHVEARNITKSDLSKVYLMAP
jgi:prepilin-type processing-associated H-X9-DG protein/prepilin-type N-terminal cleavage/methylation domain-containing protein